MKRAAYLGSAVAVLIALCGFVLWQYYPMIRVGINYKAKVLCSGVFVSKRQPASVLSEELTLDGFEALGYFRTNIDRNAKTVTVSAMGFLPVVAAYREGLGCALAIDIAPDVIRTESLAQNAISKSAPQSAMLWPDGDRVDLAAIPSNVDRNKLAAAVAMAFSEPNPTALQRTRSVVVVHRGRIIAEQYADGFGETTAQFGWSISKSVLNALIGIATDNVEVAGQLHTPLTLESANLLPEWREDRRSTISLGDLLRMSSGLSFSEDYEDYSGDALKMLFASDNKGAFAARMPLRSAPGATWSYSSGTSNILAYVLRGRFKRMSDYLAFPRRYLFEPAGMRSALLEPDASGSFVASSFAYATARDWARLGLLYLQDGMWAGRRILPKGWVERSTKPAKSAPHALYGLHIWLKIPDAPNFGEPPMPEDSFYMLGHAGQVVAIVPTRSLIIVRLGLARKRGAWKPGKILGAIAAAFPTDN